jgi:hypothetical protein
MKVTIDGTTYDYDGRMRLSEAVRIKTTLGLTIVEMERGLQPDVGDPIAMQALVWLVMYRAGQRQLDPRQVDCDLASIAIELPPEAGSSEPDSPEVPEVAELPEVAAASSPLLPPATSSSPQNNGSRGGGALVPHDGTAAQAAQAPGAPLQVVPADAGETTLPNLGAPGSMTTPRRGPST